MSISANGVAWAGRRVLMAALVLAGIGCVEDTPMAPVTVTPTERVLIQYWHFNNLAEGTLANPIAADVSKVAGATVSYPGTGAGYADRIDGTDLNAQEGAVPGYAYRARNPASTRELIIAAPSTGYKDLVFSFASTRTSSGAQTEEVYYSVDGAKWVQIGTTITVTQDVFTVQTFDLTSVAAVNNKAGLRFRILQTGAAAAGTSGNNRFDNIVLQGRAGT